MTKTSPQIREEREGVRQGVYALNSLAFPTDAEARLVDRLRDAGEVLASIVAIRGEQLVGHALFTRAKIEYAATSLPIAALGPVAVSTDRQREESAAP